MYHNPGRPRIPRYIAAPNPTTPPPPPPPRDFPRPLSARIITIVSSLPHPGAYRLLCRRHELILIVPRHTRQLGKVEHIAVTVIAIIHGGIGPHRRRQQMIIGAGVSRVIIID